MKNISKKEKMIHKYVFKLKETRKVIDNILKFKLRCIKMFKYICYHILFSFCPKKIV